MSNQIRGYKVFNPDWTCRGYQYSCPGIFEEDCQPVMCQCGFHFCLNLSDCFNYYRFDPKNKVAEVVCLGEFVSTGDKSCTNKLEIVRELSWGEVLSLVNSGDGNSGNKNSGSWNSGNRNSGNRNSGNWNSGSWNSGCWNSGNRNSGNWNSGSWNSGNKNSGDGNSGCWNSGNRNSGNWNSGDWNSGNKNSGDGNSGSYNSGSGNSGSYNSGSWNSGDGNSGNKNSGSWNSGDGNSGDWNNTHCSNGCFNTKPSKIYLFNKLSDWTYLEWARSEAHGILQDMPRVLKWVAFGSMTDDEKQENPKAETTGGYLKEVDATEERQRWWNGLPDDAKQAVKDIPNFDAEIFRQITGIETN